MDKTCKSNTNEKLIRLEGAVLEAIKRQKPSASDRAMGRVHQPDDPVAMLSRTPIDPENPEVVFCAPVEDIPALNGRPVMIVTPFLRKHLTKKSRFKDIVDFVAATD